MHNIVIYIITCCSESETASPGQIQIPDRIRKNDGQISEDLAADTGDENEENYQVLTLRESIVHEFVQLNLLRHFEQ